MQRYKPLGFPWASPELPSFYLLAECFMEDDSLWEPEVPRSFTGPRSQDYNSQNPELQGARVRRSGEGSGAELSMAVSSLCTSLLSPSLLWVLRCF